MAYSILIVDDDRTFVEELKSALQWNRLRITEVYTAFSVREAIAFLSKTKADIVLCDIEMPGGNGLQLLKWIRENHASMECIVLSSYAEFSYAQSALRFDVCDYLLKPIKAKELEETISRVVGLLDARRGWQEEPLETLWAALFDGAVKQADFTRQAQKHGLTENSSLAILLLRFVPVPGQPVPSHYGRPLVRQAILDLADQNALQTVVRLSETRWILVCRAAGKDPFPRAPLAAFLDAVEARIGLQVCAYCGEKGTVGQAVSMWEALCQLEKHTVPDMQRIAQGVDLPADKTQRRSFPLKTWKKMLVGFGPLTSLEASIREEMVRVQAEEGWTVNRLTVFLRTCTLMLSNYLQSRDMSLEDIIDSEEYDQMETFAVSSLCATAWFMHKILGIVEGSRDHKSDAITTVCQYILDNLEEDLSRKMLAKLVFMSEDYLSKQFMRAVGMTLSAYIAQKRMEKAKELLEYPDIKIGKVAMRVGYSNFSYFSKTFHDYTGFTPNEWRMYHLHGTEDTRKEPGKNPERIANRSCGLRPVYALPH